MRKLKTRIVDGVEVEESSGNVSERKLMECLTRLGYDIEIAVRPSKRRTGQLTVAVA